MPPIEPVTPPRFVESPQGFPEPPPRVTPVAIVWELEALSEVGGAATISLSSLERSVVGVKIVLTLYELACEGMVCWDPWFNSSLANLPVSSSNKDFIDSVSESDIVQAGT